MISQLTKFKQRAMKSDTTILVTSACVVKYSIRSTTILKTVITATKSMTKLSLADLVVKFSVKSVLFCWQQRKSMRLSNNDH